MLITLKGYGSIKGKILKYTKTLLVSLPLRWPYFSLQLVSEPLVVPFKLINGIYIRESISFYCDYACLERDGTLGIHIYNYMFECMDLYMLL